MKSILVVNENPRFQEMVLRALGEVHYVWWAPNAARALELLTDLPVDLVIAPFATPGTNSGEILEPLRREHPNLKFVLIIEHGTPEVAIKDLRERVCDFLCSPFTTTELRAAVDAAITGCPAREIDVVSAQPEWVELRVPCDQAISFPLQKLLAELETDLPPDMAEAICYAFSEMVSNAIEHGCKLNPNERVTISILRLEHAVICRIKDPGEGFDPSELDHAALNNPVDDPFRHVGIREQKGLRAGGFGIVMTRQLVDDLVYNERHNELMFVKFLP